MGQGRQCIEQCIEQCDVCSAVHAGLISFVNDRQAEVHDYLKHQESARDAQERKTKAQKAADARWGRDGNASSNASSNTEETRGEERKKKASPSTRRARETPLPADWTPTDEHRTKSLELRVDLDREAAAFRAHAEAHDRRAVRWNAAFNQWLIKARPATQQGGRYPTAREEQLMNLKRLHDEQVASEGHAS